MAASPPSVFVAPQPMVGASLDHVHLPAKPPSPAGRRGCRAYRSREGIPSPTRRACIWSASGFQPARAGRWTLRVRAGGRIRLRKVIKVLPAPMRRPVPPAATFVPSWRCRLCATIPCECHVARSSWDKFDARTVGAHLGRDIRRSRARRCCRTRRAATSKSFWRMTGSGDPTFTLIGRTDRRFGVPRGSPHASNWQRPGDEWGSIFFFSQPGCWRIHVERGEASADLWIALHRRGNKRLSWASVPGMSPERSPNRCSYRPLVRPRDLTPRGHLGRRFARRREHEFEGAHCAANASHLPFADVADHEVT